MSTNNSENALPVSVDSGKWDLTLYDQHRTPHEPVTEESEVAISPRSINSELMCPICLDLLKMTMTTKECLHRFCSNCITTALRNGNKECPSCRKKLVSKRSLRRDPNVDSLIDKIYPNREEYDRMQEKALQNLNKHHSTEALQKSIEEGMKSQAESRRSGRCQASSVELNGKIKRTRIDVNDWIDGNTTVKKEATLAAPTSMCLSLSRSKVSEIEFILRPHPDMETLVDVPNVIKQTRYMRTTANATVDHLINFVVLRIKLDYDESIRSASDASFFQLSSKKSISNENESPAKIDNAGKSPEVKSISVTSSPIKIKKSPQQPNPDVLCRLYVAKGGALNPTVAALSRLNGDLTLDQVLTKFWCVKRPLELHFFVDYCRLFGENGETVTATIVDSEKLLPSLKSND